MGREEVSVAGERVPDQHALESLARRVATQVRWRRAEHWALRGLFWGAVAGVLVLAAKVVLEAWAVEAAAGLVVLGLVGGALWGLARPVDRLDAARLADRGWELHDRIATALEWAPRPDRTPLVEALVADAAARARAVEARQIVRRVLPREARWLPLPVLAALGLVLAPPLPLSSLPFADLSPTPEEEEARDRGGGEIPEQDRRRRPKDLLRRAGWQERDFGQHAGSGASPTAGDLNAVFKDTALATQRPDFQSFLKQADERLKLLEQADRLPDLQADFTTSQYKMIFRKAKALTGGLRPDQISPQKLRELLEEMERLGRKGGGNWGAEVDEGFEALEYGQHDRALEAMEKALQKLRAMEERQRAGKNLRGGREADRSGRASAGAAATRASRTSVRGRGCCPGGGGAHHPRGKPASACRPCPTTSAWRARCAKAGRRRTTPT